MSKKQKGQTFLSLQILTCPLISLNKPLLIHLLSLQVIKEITRLLSDRSEYMNALYHHAELKSLLIIICLYRLKLMVFSLQILDFRILFRVQEIITIVNSSNIKRAIAIQHMHRKTISTKHHQLLHHTLEALRMDLSLLDERRK